MAYAFRYLFMSCCWLATLTGFAQSERIDDAAFNRQYLEHLVKTKIDAVRKEHACEPLVNDSILYVASLHHSDYMRSKGAISHYENDSVLTKTPQLRAEFYGAKQYGVGENVLYTTYNATVTGKHGEQFDTHTYEGLANAIVNSWVNSPGHFKNIITADYQVTGLSVAIDPAKHRIYACQKFAQVYYRYAFEENRALFPYSTYVPPAPVTGFDGIPSELIVPHTYDFGLRHDRLSACDDCAEVLASPPYLTLRVEQNTFILKVENSAFVQELIRDRLDGFAVEIVTFDDYMCGNPAYYTKPGRRNGQLRLNGKVLKPLYRKDLFHGYKKRKSRKDIRFLPYIFQRDSVAFFKRFGRYKVDRFTSEYFEIRLGKVPKNIGGLWAHNLVYIQDKQICHIDYFTGYCGELYKEFQDPGFVSPPSEGAYDLPPDRLKLPFTIPFEKGKSEFGAADISPFLASISDLSYTIDSIAITAYSSVEGDSLTNQQLQQRRAESIAEVIRKNHTAFIPARIRTLTDWDHFYRTARSTPAVSDLARLPKMAIVKELQRTGSARAESILQPERRGEVTLYCTIPIEDRNLQHLIRKEHQRLLKACDAPNAPDHEVSMYTFDRLYGYVHHLVIAGKLPPAFLAGLALPKQYAAFHPLAEKFVFYGYEFEAAFGSNVRWVQDHRAGLNLVMECGEPDKHLSPAFIYQAIRIETGERIAAGKFAPTPIIDSLLKRGRYLEQLYESDSTARMQIDRLNFNLNVLLLNGTFTTDLLKYSSDATKSIAQLYQFYQRYGQMNEDRALQLAQCAVFYSDITSAVGILRPYATTDSSLAYLLPLLYQHPSFLSSDSERFSVQDYYDELMQHAETMAPKVWCNLFLKECGIPFQVFDNDPLRQIFCAKCMEENEQLQQLIGNGQ